jgi:glycerol kinase
MVKSTYGSGGFALLNTGTQALTSKHGLLTTLSYRIEGKAHYALEGSIFNAGTAIQWLQDGLGLIESAAETDTYAKTSTDSSGVIFVPAFTGLGAPHWDPHARGSIYGLTRNSSPADLVRAALESIGYQSAELLDVLITDGDTDISTLRVDGGMAQNDWMLQFLSDITGINVERSRTIETTALGASHLANLGTGALNSIADLPNLWKLDKQFSPQISSTKRKFLLSNWARAIQSTRSFAPN